jgi:hypothetical protein
MAWGDDKNDGDPYDYWVQHITNPADVAQGKAPIIEDKGPYRFIKYSKKFDVSFDGDLSTRRSSGGYRYVAAESCGARKGEKTNCVSEMDNITFVNPNYIGLIENPTLAAGGGEETLVPIIGSVAYGSAVYQEVNGVKGPLDPSGGLLRTIGVMTYLPAIVAGGFVPYFSAVFTAQCTADIAAGTNAPTDCVPTAPTAKYGASAFKAFQTFLGQVLKEDGASPQLSGANVDFLQLGANAYANSGKAPGGADKASVAGMIYDSTAASDATKTKMYGLLYGGTAEITKNSLILGSLLKVMLASSGSTSAVDIAKLQAAVKSTTGIVRYWIIALKNMIGSKGDLPNVYTDAVQGELVAKIVAETTAAKAAGVTGAVAFTPTTVSGIAGWLAGVFVLADTNKLGPAAAKLFCPKVLDAQGNATTVGAPACSPTSSTDIAAIQFLYGTAYSTLTLVGTTATASAVAASSKIVAGQLMKQNIPMDTEIFGLAKASKAWPATQASITTAGKVLKALRGEFDLSGFTGASAVKLTLQDKYKTWSATASATLEGAAGQIDAGIAAAKAKAAADLLASKAVPDKATADAAAKAAVDKDAATIASLAQKNRDAAGLRRTQSGCRRIHRKHKSNLCHDVIGRSGCNWQHPRERKDQRGLGC